jgi:hypothetical protein
LSKYKRIRIRNDDVLVHSSGFAGREFNRFKGFHEVICQDMEHFMHVPAILATEIQEFPECVEFIKMETAAGRMFPEVHGWQHKDYAKLSAAEVTGELVLAKQFVQDTFKCYPTIWYSPHGAGADKHGAHLADAALQAGLTLVTCANMILPARIVNDVRAARDGKITVEMLASKWAGKEILRHWWEGVGALNESIKFFKENVK